MENVIFSPSIFKFNDVLIASHPIDFNFSVTNNRNDSIYIDFGSISTDNHWFTETNESFELQKKTGFELFFHMKKLSMMNLPPNSTRQISFNLIPNLCCSNFPDSFSFPVYVSNDSIPDASDQPTLIEIPIEIHFTEISFKISPRNLFLNECCKGQKQTKEFMIKNRCSHKLPIMIYPPDNISVITPDLPNYIEINPQETVTLTISHTPSEIGQFNYTILFDCILSSKIKPQEMKLMVSVSPPVIPPDFPIITPENSLLEFGEIYAGIFSSKSITITNTGDTTYDLHISGVLDIFESECKSPSQLLFQSAITSSNSQKELSIKLPPHSGITVFIKYFPSFHLTADTQSFEHRTFMIALTFYNSKTHSSYYRKIKCKSLICHSMITATPTTIDFGDTFVGRTDQTASIQINNLSPLPARVRILTSARSLVVPPGELIIPASSNSKFVVQFYPKRINPDYNSTIIITNKNNSSNEIHISVQAIIVAAASESLHSMCYSLYNDGVHLTSLDLRNCATNYPMLKSFIIKNKTASPLNIRLSSSTDEISFYAENDSVQSESSTDFTISQFPVNSSSQISSIDTIQLLTNSVSITSLKQLEPYLKSNSEFFSNAFSFLDTNTEEAVVQHFALIEKYVKDLINDPSMTKLNDQELQIPPQERIEVFVLLIPNLNTLLWKHRIEKLSIVLLNLPIEIQMQEQKKNPKDLKPLEIPVIFNEATSASFVSSHSLSFGTIQRNNVYQRKLYIMNESALPLLFNFKSAEVLFKTKKTGVVLPFGSISAPFSLCPKIDGEMLEKIFVQNILNPNEQQEVQIRGTVYKRSNFIVNPISIDFGNVYLGQSSTKFLVFVTNTSSADNEFNFSHFHREELQCKPLITFQLKNSDSRRLNESMRIQVEKMEQKVRCLQRKKKAAYAERLQVLIENLKSGQIQNDGNAQLKHMMNTKYMDRFTFHAAPLQMICVELQLIPSLKSGKRSLLVDCEIEGSILIYEKGKTETQKAIHYRAHLSQQVNKFLHDNSLVNSNNSSIVFDPASVVINDIQVQVCKSVEITVKNNSNEVQNYWISSDSTYHCIISVPKSEGSIKPKEEEIIRVDIFCTLPGDMKRSITFTTETTTLVIPFQIHAEYQKLLVFTDLLTTPMEIDFGYFPLSSLQIVEQRTSFTICNPSFVPLYVKIINNDENDIVVYEQDPREPLNLPFLMNPKTTVIMNVMMKPEIDPVPYLKYKTKTIDATLTIETFQTIDEANGSSPCLSLDVIKVKAKIGRVGLFLSDYVMDFGTVKKQQPVEMTFTVKNKSSRIPIDVMITCFQGLSVDQPVFHLEGRRIIQNHVSTPLSMMPMKLTDSSSNLMSETSSTINMDDSNKKNNENLSNYKEIKLKFTPSNDGLNESKITFSINGLPSYSKSCNVVAFVDPGVLQTDLPVNEKNQYYLDVGKIYVNNGHPVPKFTNVSFTNVSNISLSFSFMGRRYYLPTKKQQTINFDFPPSNYEFNPDETNINYRLTAKSLTTQRILAVIDVIGEFVVSLGTISQDSVCLGQFGEFNNFEYDDQSVSIMNKSDIPLIIQPSCKPPLLTLPTDKLDPIQPNDKLDFRLIPNIDQLKTAEGTQNVVLSFVNQNNIKNVMKVSVVFEILSSVLQFGRIVDSQGIKKVVLHKFTAFSVPDEESETGTVDTYIANSWFTVLNRRNSECSIQIDVEVLLPDLVSIDVLSRKTEMKVTEVDLQPNEISEIRVKANLKKLKGFDKKAEYEFANLIFKPNDADRIIVQVVYNYSDSN